MTLSLLNALMAAIGYFMTACFIIFLLFHIPSYVRHIRDTTVFVNRMWYVAKLYDDTKFRIKLRLQLVWYWLKLAIGYSIIPLHTTSVDGHRIFWPGKEGERNHF